MPGLIECVPNFSEGRRPEVVEEIVHAIGQIDGVTRARSLDATRPTTAASSPLPAAPNPW